MKLGEALLKEGLISQEQLNMALERQVIFGGRIGTNIVELGILKEDEFTSFLSRYYRLPAVLQESVLSIPEDVINSLKKDVVERYRVLPFKKERSRLHIAMIDPRDIKTIDELKFITGLDIVPYVISEIRLLYLLEKYYGIKRDLRYISIIEKEPLQEEISDDSLEKIKYELLDVKDRDEIARILVREGSRITSRVGLFLVRGGKISGWKSKGMDISEFEISENEPSIFSEVIKNKQFYRGPLFNIKENEPLIKILGGTPKDIVAIPVMIRDRVVCILYMDNGNTSVLNANIAYIMKITSMATIVFEILILRKKLLES